MLDLPDSLQEIIDEDSYHGLLWDDRVNVIYDKVVDTLRWSNVNEAVIEHDGHFYMLDYQSPATEYQEGGDFDDYELYEVEPYEVTVTKYKKK